MIIVRDRIIARLLQLRGQPGIITLLPHVSADGDALGSALALALALQALGLKPRILVDEPVSHRLSFLPAIDSIEVYPCEGPADPVSGQLMAIAIDCADSERVGCRQEIFDKAPLQAALDHHVSSGESTGLKFVDPSAAATGEIVADVIAELGRQAGLDLLTPDIAMLLMAAIISDTGGFVYSNTSARSFATAATLMAARPDLRRITYQLFDLTSQKRLRLTGRVFTDTRFALGGRVALAIVDQALLNAYEAGDGDLDGIVAELRNVAGVEVAVLIRELADGTIRANLRSNDAFNAAEFARRFGGGGHPKAAGMTLRGVAPSAAADLILAEIGQRLS